MAHTQAGVRPALPARFRVGSDTLNRQLYEGFMQHCDAPGVKKTHLFHGRYENIYLDEHHVPALGSLLSLVRGKAETLLQRRDLAIGCWFNHMPPQALTTRHNHDDGFELLSAVYYVRVPANSGKLILHGDPVQRITPEAGLLLFFPPTLDHEVSPNHSDEHRLSIAFNIGPDFHAEHRS